MALHGTYTHRVTCNLYPHQHELLLTTARSFGAKLAPFLRDAAIAYCQRRTMLPDSLQKHLGQMIQEIRRVGTNLNQMAAHANSFQRVTHQDLRNAGKLVLTLERVVGVLQKTLEELPSDSQAHDHQVDGA
ncbi:MAG: plasmid mobilization relaxosome protein MobC [Acidobacteriota bacterium]|nr:plasmid mobilization relaxosome protein MobC [Acidobacteriota bacterium]